MEKIMWLVLGGVALVAALRAGHSTRAMYVGRWALAVLFVVFGAAVNAVYLATGTDYYAEFAKPSPFAFVRDTWESLVLPHQWFFIGLLIVAEAVAGVALLLGGRWTQGALLAFIGFHLGQLPFGGVMWVWAPLMIVTFSLLLRAERRTGLDQSRVPDAVIGRRTSPTPSVRSGPASPEATDDGGRTWSGSSTVGRSAGS